MERQAEQQLRELRQQKEQERGEADARAADTEASLRQRVQVCALSCSLSAMQTFSEKYDAALRCAVHDDIRQRDALQLVCAGGHDNAIFCFAIFCRVWNP